MESESISIRHLSTYAELQELGKLQFEIWGDDFIEIVPPSLLKVAQKIGGIVAGAFSNENELVAFVYGLPGRRNGVEIHWSHMLGVHPQWRGRGIGSRLKIFQRNFVIEQGIRKICWTFDPLESVNAHLNIERLGALPDEYVCDLYGDGSFSKLSQGIGTDRFITTWFLYEEDRIAHINTYAVPDEAGGMPRVIDEQLSFREIPTTKSVLIKIPDNIQRLKAVDSEQAMAWRIATRNAFLYYFGKGFVVTGLHEVTGREKRVNALHMDRFYVVSPPCESK